MKVGIDITSYTHDEHEVLPSEGKNKGGRPLTGKEPRNITIKLLVTATERKAIQQLADDKGVSISTLLRMGLQEVANG